MNRWKAPTLRHQVKAVLKLCSDSQHFKVMLDIVDKFFFFYLQAVVTA